MEQPQEYLSNKDLVSNKYKLKNDIESNKKSPIYHLDESGKRID